MPSHISHVLFAQRVLQLPQWTSASLAIGAQGPDIFYHNQRTSPRGLGIGISLHRHHYGRFCALLVEHFARQGHGPDSEAGVFLGAFMSHGILDRVLHPYINGLAGTFYPGFPETKRFRYAHPFFERVMDQVYASDLEGCAAQDLDFAQVFDQGPQIPPLIAQGLHHGVVHSMAKRAKDPELAQKIQNAYGDSRGYYLWSQEEARTRTAPSTSPTVDDDTIRYIAILHPRALPRDMLTKLELPWYLPASKSQIRITPTILWERALTMATDTWKQVQDSWETMASHSPPGDRDGVEELGEIIGNQSLSSESGESEEERNPTVEPLDLRSVMAQLIHDPEPELWWRPGLG